MELDTNEEDCLTHVWLTILYDWNHSTDLNAYRQPVPLLEQVNKPVPIVEQVNFGAQYVPTDPFFTRF